MATRKNKRNKIKENENDKDKTEKEGNKNEGNKNEGNKTKNRKTRRNKNNFQKTKLYKLYLAELEKLRGGGLEEVEKFMGGDWLDDLGIRKLGSLISEATSGTLEFSYLLFGFSGLLIKKSIEAVWISKIYHWVKENIWENSFVRGFFDIFMKVGGKIGEAIYFIYILLNKIVIDIMDKKLRSVWVWVLSLITTLGVFDWAGSSGLLGSTIGSFFAGPANGAIVGFFYTFNFWNFLGTIITGIFSILGNVWGGVTTFISSYLFFSSFFQVVLVIAVLWGLNNLRLDYNKTNSELIELSKPKKLRNTIKNQKETKAKVLSENENEPEFEKSLQPSSSVSDSNRRPPLFGVKKKKSKKALESIPEQALEEEEDKNAISVRSFNVPYKNAVEERNLQNQSKESGNTDNTSSFQRLRANFARNGKVPIPTNENGLRGGSGFQNLSTKKILEKLNKVSKSTFDESKESNGMGFQLALLCGFIKDTKNGYVFTPHAAKTIKTVILSSQTSIQKNCKDCKIGGKRVDEKSDTNKRTTRKNNEDIDGFDLDSIIDTLKAFEFVQTATVHALVRESNETMKGGNMKGGNMKSQEHKKGEPDIQNVLHHLKKEDIEWLQERDPEQIKIAIKLGILTPDLELTEIATGIAKDGDNINGVSIKAQFDKYYSSVSQ